MGKATDFIKKCLFWHVIRRQRIIRQHSRVVAMCDQLIADCHNHSEENLSTQLGTNITDQVIWQYWAQGYDNVPEVVDKCLKSVEQWKDDYTIVRLTDNNLSDYIQLPYYILEKKEKGIIPLAQFSDILRVCLLSIYGGIWLDATILLTGPIPQRYREMDFFVYQREPNEPNQKYWENAYAYYYGWSKGFRVNMLSSVIFAKKDSKVLQELCHLMLYYWKKHDELPDYFFLHILFDTLINGKLKGENCPIESDCTPHLMQQMINDPEFKLATKEEILKMTTIHKLTYK